MRKLFTFLLRLGMVAGISFAIICVGMFAAVENDLFLVEPQALGELRQRDGYGANDWPARQIAWINIYDTHINYPIMQGEDNIWYLSHDFEEHEAEMGTVFLDYRNASDFSDQLSIIYGHRTNSYLMFTDVAKYEDDNYFHEHPAGELILRDRKYQLTALEFRRLSADDGVYQYFDSTYPGKKVLLLSTCDRSARDTRDVLLMQIEDIYGKIY